MTLSAMPQPFDLTNCDKEKIHQISYVQGHGAFMAVSLRDQRIQHVSQNLAQYFETTFPSLDLIGKKIQEILGLDLTSRILSAMKSREFAKKKKIHFTALAAKQLDVFIYPLSEQLLGIEVEEIPSSEVDEERESSSLVRDAMVQMKSLKSEEEFGKIACQYVRQIIGFERVMLYKFFPPSMYGQVIAEDKIAEAKTFNHHRFPATDIPKPARDLYLQNSVRFIHDSSDTGSEVVPKVDASTGLPLNFSDSRLRGVSLIHLEYLKNMNVAASFSLAVVVDGKLWGLIACHHSKAKYISHKNREQAELLAQVVALTVPVLEKKTASENALKFHEGLNEIFSTLKTSHHPIGELFRHPEIVNNMFSSTGYALLSSTNIDFAGVTPRSDDLRAIWGSIKSEMDSSGTSFFHTESLSSLDPKFESIKGFASGVMAFSLSEVDDLIFIVLRPEYLQTILWGGDPRKNFEERNYKGLINPRLSFDTWAEVIKSHSLPWTKSEIDGLKVFKNYIFDSLIRKEQLIQELQQKIKNLNA